MRNLPCKTTTLLSTPVSRLVIVVLTVAPAVALTMAVAVELLVEPPVAVTVMP